MKKNKFLLSLALLGCVPVWAEGLPKDTVRVIDVEEVVVIAKRRFLNRLASLILVLVSVGKSYKTSTHIIR